VIKFRFTKVNGQQKRCRFPEVSSVFPQIPPVGLAAQFYWSSTFCMTFSYLVRWLFQGRSAEERNKRRWACLSAKSSLSRSDASTTSDQRIDTICWQHRRRHWRTSADISRTSIEYRYQWLWTVFSGFGRILNQLSETRRYRLNSLCPADDEHWAVCSDVTNSLDAFGCDFCTILPFLSEIRHFDSRFVLLCHYTRAKVAVQQSFRSSWMVDVQIKLMYKSVE